MHEIFSVSGQKIANCSHVNFISVYQNARVDTTIKVYIIFNIPLSVHDGGYLFLFDLIHPAGDVTRVSVVSRKVTVKIGDVENGWRGCQLR